jgi:hypothetical protein
MRSRINRYNQVQIGVIAPLVSNSGVNTPSTADLDLNTGPGRKCDKGEDVIRSHE